MEHHIAHIAQKRYLALCYTIDHNLDLIRKQRYLVIRKCYLIEFGWLVLSGCVV
jgi:hypothetical protein